MKKCVFLDKRGSFELADAQQYTGFYFPLASESGLKSAVTPNLAGDAKTDQNHFLLSPASIENLSNERNTRSFWCVIKGGQPWCATGNSAWQIAQTFTEEEEQVTVQAGYMWHKTMRTAKKYPLSAQVTSFIPVQKNVEIHQIRITNTGEQEISFAPVAAVPIYGRSADNIRDHRHVTSLLHRTAVTRRGVHVFPTLSFDERGHQRGDALYFVEGMDAQGNCPQEFYPEMDVFTGNGGNLEHPRALFEDQPGVKSGYTVNGQEALGGLRFAEVTLKGGESAEYIVFAGVCSSEEELEAMLAEYRTAAEVDAEFTRTCEYWKKKINVTYETADENFNQFMNWVSFQPELRRLFGCSFLPHHDYGKGGRGWRDLWQDCLALLLMDPDGVRKMLLGNFAGVRIDGTNATIVGSKPGEFKADRNSITRVWMDHGVWPLLTTKLYIDQTGDIDILNEKVVYFKDRQVHRGTKTDERWNGESTWQMEENGAEYEGTVLEHLLLQNLIAFWETGEHNHIRLRDADWNDALDMAGERGESVAFTNMYASNLLNLADLIEHAAANGNGTFRILREAQVLLRDGELWYEDTNQKKEILNEYLSQCSHRVSGDYLELDGAELAANLRKKGRWMQEHIRRTEWLTDSRGNSWFNGYYDNSGRRLEGERNGKSHMMLTSQVFPVMGGTATKEQVAAIVKSADEYLYDGSCGGYRLNTNFEEIKTDMGRMFGFAYGEKENGAVFSHMTVMYANALYQRGFAEEGFRALNALYAQSMDFEKSLIYPGLPEYFGRGGRGLYHYLTGSASWYMLTVINQMFGVRGEYGDLIVEPKLVKEQFDSEGNAALGLQFAGQAWEIRIENPEHLEYGEYEVRCAELDGEELNGDEAAGNGLTGDEMTGEDLVGNERNEKRSVRVLLEKINQLNTDRTHTIVIKLGQKGEKPS